MGFRCILCVYLSGYSELLALFRSEMALETDRAPYRCPGGGGGGGGYDKKNACVT